MFPFSLAQYILLLLLFIFVFIFIFKGVATYCKSTTYKIKGRVDVRISRVNVSFGIANVSISRVIVRIGRANVMI